MDSSFDVQDEDEVDRTKAIQQTPVSGKSGVSTKSVKIFSRQINGMLQPIVEGDESDDGELIEQTGNGRPKKHRTAEEEEEEEDVRVKPSPGRSKKRTPRKKRDGRMNASSASLGGAGATVVFAEPSGDLAVADMENLTNEELKAIMHKRKTQVSTTLSFTEIPLFRFMKQVAGDAAIIDMWAVFEDIDILDWVRHYKVLEENDFDRYTMKIRTHMMMIKSGNFAFKEEHFPSLLRPIPYAGWQATDQAVRLHLGMSLVQFVETNKVLVVRDAVSKFFAAIILENTFNNNQTQMKGALVLARIRGYRTIFEGVMRAHKAGRI